MRFFSKLFSKNNTPTLRFVFKSGNSGGPLAMCSHCEASTEQIGRAVQQWWGGTHKVLAVICHACGQEVKFTDLLQFNQDHIKDRSGEVIDNPIVEQTGGSILKIFNELNTKLIADPLDSNSWTAKGVVYSQINCPLEALQCYAKSLDSDSQQPDVLTYSGQIWIRADIHKASQLFDRALNIDSKHLEARLGKGTVAMTSGSIGQALKYFDEVLELTPENGKAWFLKSNALDRLGKSAESMACRERANAFGFGLKK